MPRGGRKIDGHAAAFLTGWVALVFGGWTMSALRLRRVRIPPLVVGVAVAAGVALLVAGVAAVPGDYPDYNTAPGSVKSLGNDAFLEWAFAQVLPDAHRAAVLLTAAVALLAPLAVSRWDRGVRLPVPAVLVGVVNTVLAGFVLAVNGWNLMISLVMSGP